MRKLTSEKPNISPNVRNWADLSPDPAPWALAVARAHEFFASCRQQLRDEVPPGALEQPRTR